MFSVLFGKRAYTSITDWNGDGSLGSAPLACRIRRLAEYIPTRYLSINVKFYKSR
jgi:hypothetical protein